MELSNSAIDKIGNIIRHDKNAAKAIEKLNLWREAHGPLLDEYYDKCVKLASNISENVIVVQRLKRQMFFVALL